MKQVILMVGPMGAGKSTWTQSYISDYYRISQDEMGKDGHKQAYQSALKTKDKIVVDRINHTKQQREWYL